MRDRRTDWITIILQCYRLLNMNAPELFVGPMTVALAKTAHHF
jgi:hypothetical protein